MHFARQDKFGVGQALNHFWYGTCCYFVKGINPAFSPRSMMNPHADASYPVSVVLSRHMLHKGQWQFPSWEIVELLPRHTPPQEDGQDYARIQNDKGEEQFIWSDMWLDLFRDGLQSYYQNLTGKHPSVFVLCRDDHPETGMAPVSVSANFADAEAHMETDGMVLSTPLIPPFSKWLADYVLHNESVLNRQVQEHKGGKKGKRRHV